MEINNSISIIILLFLTTCSSLFCQDKDSVFSLFYEQNQYALTQSHKRTLDSLFVELERISVSDIRIVTYASSLGNTGDNFLLSQRRALELKNYFPDNFTISIKPLGEKSGDARISRRADILYRKVFKQQNLKNKIEEANVGDKIILEGIYFKPGLDILLEDSRIKLKDLLVYFRANEVKFKILGHICCSVKRPTIDGYNRRTKLSNLSEARAKVIYKYFIKNGVDKNRMTYQGMAYRFPLGGEPEKDRRVEIEIISMD
jgi:outer membrane protein OmpA-like peptidoglycan-associated protein